MDKYAAFLLTAASGGFSNTSVMMAGFMYREAKRINHLKLVDLGFVNQIGKQSRVLVIPLAAGKYRIGKPYKKSGAG